MGKPPLRILCTSASIKEGSGATKSTMDADVCLEGLDLFVDGSRWRFKLKEMTELSVKDDEISIRFESKTKEHAILLIISSQNETNELGNFVKRLTVYHDKNRHKEKRAGFGGMASKARSKAQSYRMPWDEKDDKVRKKKICTTLAERQEKNRALYERHEPTATFPSKPRSAPLLPSKQSLLVDDTESESDDDGEQEIRDIDVTSRMDDVDASMADGEQDDEDDRPVHKLSKKRRIIEDGDESEEDLLPRKCAQLTTPAAATNIVSPWTSAVATGEEIGGDNDAEQPSSDQENSIITSIKNQPRISQFFPSVQTASFSPSKLRPEVLTPVSSPTNKLLYQPPSSASRVIFPSASGRKNGSSQRSIDMVAVTQRKTKNTLNSVPNWLLHNSKLERAQSSAEKRRGNLFLSSSARELPFDQIEVEPDASDEVKPPQLKRNYFDTRRQNGKSGKTFLASNHFHRNNILGASSDYADPVVEQPRYRGLRNLGNTCYMNSSLQMLYSCRTFMTALQQSPGGELVQSVCDIYRELQRFDLAATAAQPNQIKQAIDKKTEKFLGYEQRDAHEFLADLIDHLDEEIEGGNNNSIKEVTTAKNTPARPTDDFCLTVRAHLQCTSCGYLRHKDEMHRCLSVDIVQDPESGEASIASSVKQFFEPELREIKCEKCEDGTHANQSLSIAIFPKILLLHLKRFIFVEQPIRNGMDNTGENKEPNSPEKPVVEMEYVFQKNKAEVDVSPTVDLSKFQVESKSPLVAGASYELKSIVRHIGRMASSGHYTADALRPNEPLGENNEDVFVTFDDHQSQRTTQRDVIGKRRETPYMIMYELMS